MLEHSAAWSVHINDCKRTDAEWSVSCDVDEVIYSHTIGQNKELTHWSE